MDTRTKKITLAVLIAVLAVIIIVSMSSKKPASAPTLPAESENAETEPMGGTADSGETMVSSAIPSQEDSKLASIKGTLLEADIASVTVADENKNEATFTFPSSGAQIFQEVKKDDGVTLQEVGLLDLETGSSIEVQFNTETKEVEFMKVLLSAE